MTAIQHFLAWWDAHREHCSDCKRDGLYSSCREYRANKEITDRHAGLAS